MGLSCVQIGYGVICIVVCVAYKLQEESVADGREKARLECLDLIASGALPR
jgi:hypothetical protein